MKITTKIFILISSISVIFMMGVILFKISEDAKVESLFKAEEKEKIISFSKTIESIGKSLEVFAYDYTYWDELVEFMNTKDRQWAKENIQQSLATYNAQYVWIYKPDFTIFFQTDTTGLKGLPLSTDNLKEMFKDTLFSHFYILVNDELLEIRGSPIQPTSDAERITKPAGYFFTGRLWGKEFLSDLAVQTSSMINLEPADDQNFLGGTQTVKTSDKDLTATASMDLYGWNGKPVGRIISSNELPMLKNLNQFINSQILYFLIIAFSILVILSVFLFFNVGKPLKIISNSLQNEDPAQLNYLKNDKAEFGRLSSLINQFFIQKNKLMDEIKQRELIESSLQKSETKYRKIFENVQDVVFQADKNRILTSVSPSVERYSEYKPDELIGKSLTAFYNNAEDAERLAREIYANGEVVNFETVLTSKTGKHINVLINSHLIYDENGDISGSEGTVRDISQLKLSEEKIKKLSRAVEQSPVSIVITDTSGKIEYVNPKFAEVSGYSFEELIGQNSRILKSGADAEEKYKDLWTTILSGKEWNGELLNKKKNGELYWESEVICPIKNSSNIVTNFLAIKEDITERKKIEIELKAAKEKAEEMNKLKSSFLANMSHELRTPLIGILGFSEILSSEVKNENWKQMLGTISSGGERLLDTLNQILDLSKFETDKVVVNYETITVNELILESVKLFTPAAAKKNLFLKTDLSEPEISAVVDRQLLRSVLNNLIGNAIKFTDSGGVSVSLIKENSNPKKYIKIKVTDTGIGIPKHYHKVIFDEFRQVREGFNKLFEGRALGLSITKRIVEIFNGEIFVESEVGKGSQFTIKLPANPFRIIPQKESPHGNHDLPENGNGSNNHKKQILFVDDDDTSKRIVKVFLRNLFTVETASDRISGLKKIRSGEYSLILLDINLGSGGTGYEILKEIRNLNNYDNVPVIAVTAYAMAAEKAAILAEGFDDYISKPFSKKELNDLVKKYLA
ncbi:MAG: PAS domain S-box protein [Ignavibacteria bacterium]